MNTFKSRSIVLVSLSGVIGFLIFLASPFRQVGGSPEGEGADELKSSEWEEPTRTKVRQRTNEGVSLVIDLADALRVFQETGAREKLIRCFDSDFSQSLAWLSKRVLVEQNSSLAKTCGFCVGCSDAIWVWANFESYFADDEECRREAKSGVIEGLLQSGRILRTLESLVEIEKGRERDQCMVQVLLVLAEFDPANAITMMKQWIEAGELLTIDRSKLLGRVVGIAKGLGDVEKVLALDDFNILGGRYPSAIARSIAETNTEMATSWSLKIEDWVQSRAAITGIVEFKVQRGLDDEAMRIIVEAENSRGGGGYIRSAVMEIAKISPEKAVLFIDKLPRNLNLHTRDAVIVLVDAWYAQDGNGLSDWVSGLEIGNKRDSALMAISMKVASSDPKLAQEWASKIGDDELRANVAKIVSVEGVE